ncbi:hypothetical protein HG530_003306 [Fusarium avenaceum]|nr:hypothetical protein HG530_003306 [Fusarium avenaceum]
MAFVVLLFLLIFPCAERIIALVDGLLLIGDTNVSRNVLLHGLLVWVKCVIVVRQDDLFVKLVRMLELGLLGCLVCSNFVVLEAAFGVVRFMSIAFLLAKMVVIFDLKSATEVLCCQAGCRQVVLIVHQVLRFRVVGGVLLVGCHSCLECLFLVRIAINGSEQTVEKTLVVALCANQRVLVEFDRHICARVGESVEIRDKRRDIDQLKILLAGVLDAFGVLEFLLGDFEALVDLALNGMR